MNQNGFEINFCRHCKNSLFDLRILKDDIEVIVSNSLHSAKRSHERIKAGLSACPNACSAPQIKDFGVIAFITPELNSEKCISCGKCYEACKEDAIDFNGYPRFNENCIGCGDCLRACDQNAITGTVGFRIVAGGKLGRHPKFAQIIKVSDDPSEIIKAFRKVVEISEKHGKRFSHIEGCVSILSSEIDQ